jgi:hypothetical protein
MARGVVTLGEVATQAERVEIACRRCDRRGVLRTERLVSEHGPDMAIPALLRLLAADCPRMKADKMHDVCGVHIPALSRLMA